MSARRVKGWYAIALMLWLIPTLFGAMLAWVFSPGLGPHPDPRPGASMTSTYLFLAGWFAIPLLLAPLGYAKHEDQE